MQSPASDPNQTDPCTSLHQMHCYKGCGLKQALLSILSAQYLQQEHCKKDPTPFCFVWGKELASQNGRAAKCRSLHLGVSILVFVWGKEQQGFRSGRVGPGSAGQAKQQRGKKQPGWLGKGGGWGAQDTFG